LGDLDPVLVTPEAYISDTDFGDEMGDILGLSAAATRPEDRGRPRFTGRSRWISTPSVPHTGLSWTTWRKILIEPVRSLGDELWTRATELGEQIYEKVVEQDYLELRFQAPG
jgi:hypothetical protein